MQPASSHSPNWPAIQYVATTMTAATAMVFFWSRSTRSRLAFGRAGRARLSRGL